MRVNTNFWHFRWNTFLLYKGKNWFGLPRRKCPFQFVLLDIPISCHLLKELEKDKNHSNNHI